MKLSIITINYNNANGLRKTMELVFSQVIGDKAMVRENFEYIVVDGASTDGSVDVIREYEQKWLSLSLAFPFTWVSEKDTGIYNAMNKGVRMAKGDYVLMLNSGDYFVDEHVVERILPELDSTDIVQGNTIDGDRRNRGYGRSNINFLDVQRGHFPHQASFCRRDLFEKYGYFDESYLYVSDTIFFIKTLGYGGASFRYVDIDVANFDMTGFSCTNNPIVCKKHYEEEVRLRRELFPGRLYAYCIDSRRKVELYDILHKNRFVWGIVVLLKRVCDKIYR